MKIKICVITVEHCDGKIVCGNCMFLDMNAITIPSGCYCDWFKNELERDGDEVFVCDKCKELVLEEDEKNREAPGCGCCSYHEYYSDDSHVCEYERDLPKVIKTKKVPKWCPLGERK